MDYEYTNAFFKVTDPTVDIVSGFTIPNGFWSRKHEYLFAMKYAAAGQIVADMGCGWHYRPLHDWLSMTCEFCYGVDSHPGILDLPQMQKGVFVVADFGNKIDAIPAGTLNRIFCISVLEELIDYDSALAEFKRLLHPHGKIIVTMDATYDKSKPAHYKYKGVDMDAFESAMLKNGLVYEGSVCRVIPENALHNDEFNLAVWHCVIKNANK